MKPLGSRHTATTELKIHLCLAYLMWYTVDRELNLMKPSWWRYRMETYLRYWPFVLGIHRYRQIPRTKTSDVFFICTWINGWVTNRKAGDLRRHRAHYDVTVTISALLVQNNATDMTLKKSIPKEIDLSLTTAGHRSRGVTGMPFISQPVLYKGPR